MNVKQLSILKDATNLFEHVSLWYLLYVPHWITYLSTIGNRSSKMSHLRSIYLSYAKYPYSLEAAIRITVTKYCHIIGWTSPPVHFFGFKKERKKTRTLKHVTIWQYLPHKKSCFLREQLHQISRQKSVHLLRGNN